MRVTGGVLAGRRLRPIPQGVRPTSDRVRESLFAWLDALEGAAVIDLYAGSGVLGIEALSRGAASVLFVERSAAVLRVLQKNLEDLGLQDDCEVRRGDAVSVLRRMARGARSFDLALVDPPYSSPELVRVLPVLASGPPLAVGGRVVVERSRRVELPALAGLRPFATRRYGDTVIDAFERVSVE